jgi:hypothetical protein
MGASLSGSGRNETVVGYTPTGAQITADFSGVTSVLGDNTTSAPAAPAAPVIDQNVIREYDQAIAQTQAGINRLPGQLQSGYGAIDASWQNALNQLLLSRNRGETSYNQATQDTKTGFVGAKNTIGSQAGEALNGLRRLLGARGAGGSSASRISAPGAVARSAGLQRAEVGGNFAKNMQGLDINWNNFLQDYSNEVSKAGTQREQGRRDLSNTIDTGHADFLRTLAQLQAQRAEAAGGNTVAAAQPYLDQANSILDRVSNYQTAPINYQTNAYQAPSLASYDVAQSPNTQFSQQSEGNYYSPYLQSLLGKKQQQVMA